MKYKVIYTKKTTDEARQMMIQADSLRQAQQIANTPDNIQPGEHCKVYCDTTTSDGLQEAALQIVKRSTASMIYREGGEIQYRLYNGCRVRHIDDTDVQDCLQVVALSLIESNANNIDVATAYLTAYRQLYNYLYSCRAVKETKQSMRTVYLEDIDGDIINVSKGINTIIKASETLPTIADEDSENIDAITDIVIDILKDFTPVQKRVIKLLANGLSERQVADKMNRAKTTIREHKTTVQKKAMQKYPNGMKDIKTLLQTLTQDK